MKNTFGNQITITLFGESHGPAVGTVIDGLPAGIPINRADIEEELVKRHSLAAVSTSRREPDPFEFVTGIKNGRTEGSPVTILIPNQNVDATSYEAIANTPRPSHADYAAHVRYRGYEDASGGGHFSGRLTAPLVAAGAIMEGMLRSRGMLIGTHILAVAGIEDQPFSLHPEEEIAALDHKRFPVLSGEAEVKMLDAIQHAREQKDSVGGLLETAVTGVPAGTGEPFFDTAEGLLSHALFSIPAVKGVEFGSGFALAAMKGSTANDSYIVRNGKAETASNHSGGINGGLTNGMPIVFHTVFRPTPSIALPQDTIRYDDLGMTTIEIRGRHDPTIVHRAAVVQSAVTAHVIADLLTMRYGGEWWTDGR